MPNEPLYTMSEEAGQPLPDFVGDPPATATEESTWRTLDDGSRHQFLQWLQDKTGARQALGRETYGDTFQGDPLAHAIEKTLDLVFCLWVAKRKRDTNDRE